MNTLEYDLDLPRRTASLKLIKFLGEARLRAEMTAKDISDKVPCHRTHLSRILNGHTVPSEHTITRIASVLDLGADGTQELRTMAQFLRDAERRSIYQGAPPVGMRVYGDFLRELKSLLSKKNCSYRKLERLEPSLRRSTIDSYMTERCTLPHHQLMKIVRACGVEEPELSAWEAAWQELVEPRVTEKASHRRKGLARKRAAMNAANGHRR